MPTAAEIIAGAEFPEQDYIVLGSLRSPGRATILSASFERKWDVREPYGAIGGTTIYHGEKIKTCEVLIELWEKSHFTEWALFRKVLFAKPGKTALTIDHPVLALIELKEVQVESVGAFEQDEEGMWSCRIRFLEFRPPKPALSKPIAAIPNAAPPRAARDALDTQIDTLTTQLKGLAGQ